MNKVDQIFVHDPDRGQVGDCVRACLATLLNRALLDLPHFAQDYPDVLELNRAINDWLRAEHGLHLIEIDYESFQDWLDFNVAGSVRHIIYGYSPRHIRHAVVGIDGVMVHDPHPSKAGLLSNASAEWTIGLLVLV